MNEGKEIRGNTCEEPKTNKPQVTPPAIMESCKILNQWNEQFYVKSYCRYCGSQDLQHKEQIVFGVPGRIDVATCRKCGGIN